MHWKHHQALLKLPASSVYCTIIDLDYIDRPHSFSRNLEWHFQIWLIRVDTDLPAMCQIGLQPHQRIGHHCSNSFCKGAQRKGLRCPVASVSGQPTNLVTSRVTLAIGGYSMLMATATFNWTHISLTYYDLSEFDDKLRRLSIWPTETSSKLSVKQQESWHLLNKN